MARNFVNVDRRTPLLLPVDLREWVPPEDIAHFVIEVVEGVDLRSARVNERGSGSAQYPPSMLAAVLIYCYLQGIHSSRAIERATHTHLGVRYITGDTHPDHDTIATFRRTQREVVREAFTQVLLMGRNLGLPGLGTVCVDGTKLHANASARQNRPDE